MTGPRASVRDTLLEAGLWFARQVITLHGVTRIGVIGSIMTTKPRPKDVDFVVSVSDDADLEALAALARRLKGWLQSHSHGADVFLANDRGRYLGRTCS